MTGIVVITYNSREVIEECLDAAARVPDARIVVVDNASTDGTLDAIRAHSDVEVIANRENRGFAAAANQGIAALESAAILLVNPDAVILRGVEALAGAVNETGVGAAGGQLVDLAGHPQDGFQVRRFPTAWTLAFEGLGLNRMWPANPVNREYRFNTQDNDNVDQPAGAFLMIRRSAWAEVGGFDERFYPVWFEDVDFCKRLKACGYRIVHVPAAVARHIGGHSTLKVTRTARQQYWYGSLLRYVSKHFTWGPRCGICLALSAGSLVRGVVEAILQRSFGPVTLYSKVCWLAWRHMAEGGYEKTTVSGGKLESTVLGARFRQ